MTYADADLPPSVSSVLRLPASADMAQMMEPPETSELDRDPRVPPGFCVMACIVVSVPVWIWLAGKAIANLAAFNVGG